MQKNSEIMQLNQRLRRIQKREEDALKSNLILLDLFCLQTTYCLKRIIGIVTIIENFQSNNYVKHIYHIQLD